MTESERAKNQAMSAALMSIMTAQQRERMKQIALAHGQNRKGRRASSSLIRHAIHEHDARVRRTMARRAAREAKAVETVLRMSRRFDRGNIAPLPGMSASTYEVIVAAIRPETDSHPGA